MDRVFVILIVLGTVAPAIAEAKPLRLLGIDQRVPASSRVIPGLRNSRLGPGAFGVSKDTLSILLRTSRMSMVRARFSSMATMRERQRQSGASSPRPAVAPGTAVVPLTGRPSRSKDSLSTFLRLRPLTGRPSWSKDSLSTFLRLMR